MLAAVVVSVTASLTSRRSCRHGVSSGATRER